MRLSELPAIPPPAPPDRDLRLHQQAQALEAAFLSEMLGFGGLGEVSESFGGGGGEDQFASFLREEQARLIAARGGIGLAEQIFESLKQRAGP